MDDLSVPPQIPEENLTRDWFALTKPDPVIAYIETAFWDREMAPGNWSVARLSSAVYVYREESTGWKIIAKFYVPKTGKDAGHHAEREFCVTQRAWEYLSSDQCCCRAVQQFYEATSILRIARNGWLSRKDRLALVLQAFALLSSNHV